MKAFAEYWQDKGDEKQETAQSILDLRAKYPDCYHADLYDEAVMPPELHKAHQLNDRAVMVWNYDEKNGNHYHCMLPERNNNHSASGKGKDVIHYLPGQIIPEPWATWYRGY